MKTIFLALAVSAALAAAPVANAQFGGLLNRGGQQADAPDAQALQALLGVPHWRETAARLAAG